MAVISLMIQDLDSLFQYSVIVEWKKGVYNYYGAFKRLLTNLRLG